MKILKQIKFIFILLFLLFHNYNYIHSATAKTVYIPNAFSTDPALSQWSWDRSYQSDNFVIFWGPVVGTDPANYSDPNLRFTPSQICSYLEAVFVKYINEIQFVSNDPATNFGKYKTIVVMNDTWGSGGPSGWAFGGNYDNIIAAMWVHPDATRDGLVVAHEFAHGCQSMQSIQENKVGGGFVNYDPSGFFWEGHANFMRSQMYPNNAGEDYPRWLMTRHFHFSSTRHHYWGPLRLLLTMQEIEGITMVNRLWKESVAREHPLVTYRRLKSWTQAQLNDFIYEYAKREVNCNYNVTNYGGTTNLGQVLRNEINRLRNNEPHYLWREYTMLTKTSNTQNRYFCPEYFAPQDYGINIIPLYPDNISQLVCVKFKGHTEVNSYAGWRYGFVAVNSSGNARYGDMYGDNEREITFQLNSGENLYLVVIGAPTAHTSYVWEPGWPKIYRFPYEICINNGVPEGYQTNFRQDIKNKYAGHTHSNGGGWVANTASVASSVYVGPKAVVLGSSNITGNVRIDGTAWVENATVRDNVIIDGNARLRGGTYSNDARITENAICYSCTVSGSPTLKGNMFSWGGNFSGTAVVGGDAELSSASSGVYLQTPHPNNGRTENDGKGANDPSNIDINAVVTPWTDAQFGNCCSGTTPSTPTYTRTRTPTLTLTRTSTPTFTRTLTGTQTPSYTRTVTFTMTRTNTVVITNTNTVTATRTNTPINTPTQTATYTSTRTNTPQITATYTGTLTGTMTRTNTVQPTNTYTGTATRTNTPQPTSTYTQTVTFTGTRTNTPQPTATYTRTLTGTMTRTNTVQSTNTRTPTLSFTNTVSSTLTFTRTPTSTWTRTATPSYTNTNTRTQTPTYTYTDTISSNTPTVTPTYTRTSTRTLTMTTTNTSTPSLTLTPTLSVTTTQTPSPSNTRTPTLTFTDTSTRTPTYTFTDTISSNTPTATPTYTMTGTRTATLTDTVTNTRTATRTITQSYTETTTNTATNTATGTRTSTPTWTMTATPSWTRTVTTTITNTPSITATYTVTPTFTSTVIPDKEEFKIENVVIMPNPYNKRGSDLKIGFEITQASKVIKVRIYTSGFRLIKQITQVGNYVVGRNTIEIESRYLDKLANGTYYIVITAINNKGVSVNSKPVILIILR